MYNKNIFNKSDYIKYIKNNTSLTDLQKNSLINYNNNKFNFFKDIDSNLQISTYYKEAIKTNNIQEIFRLQLLFMHFITIKQSYNIIDKLKLQDNLTDTEIINIIIKKNTNKNQLPTYRNWDYAIEYLSFIYRTFNKSTNIKYIDICCGSGKKTKLFSKYLKLKKENTYCTDIKQWGPYQQNISKLPFQFKYIVNDKLDYEDNYFEIATCILSLHHVKNMETFIKDMYRIIKPNGYLLLIEHSIYDDFDRLFVNIQHLLYTVFYDKRKNYIENPDYIYGYNMYEWNYIMNKCKLENKKQDILPFEIQFEVKYDNIFYGFYQKKV